MRRKEGASQLTVVLRELLGLLSELEVEIVKLLMKDEAETNKRLLIVMQAILQLKKELLGYLSEGGDKKIYGWGVSKKAKGRVTRGTLWQNLRTALKLIADALLHIIVTRGCSPEGY